MRTHAHTLQALAPSSGPGLDSSSPPPRNPTGERASGGSQREPGPGQRGRPAWTPRHFLSRLHAPSLAASEPPHRPFPPAAAGSSQSPTQGSPGRAIPYLPALRNLSGPPAASRPRSALDFRARRHGEQAPVPRLHRGCDPLRPAEGSGRLRDPGRTIRRGEQGCTKPSAGRKAATHTYRRGSGNAMGGTGLAQCR